MPREPFFVGNFSDKTLLLNMKVCSIQGCEKRHEAKGFCPMHYARFKKYGSPHETFVDHSPLIGQRFGRLTVEGPDKSGKALKWRCLCDCGLRVSVGIGNLREGQTKSCGSHRSAVELAGQRFGRLTVIKQQYSLKMKTRKRTWLCACDCGEQSLVATHALLRGLTSSCGCARIETIKAARRPYAGRKFERLLILGDVSMEPTKTRRVLVRCDCGTIRVTGMSSILNGYTKSCGCYSAEAAGLRATTHGLSKTKGYKNARLAAYRAAKLRATPSWVSIDVMREIYEQCPKGFQVDHIVPLQGKQVCGLHVPANLQYLPMADNASKNNRFTPVVLPANVPDKLPNVYWG